MLRRAKCTVYLAQETDTLGKDSELASTLAQGKSVIAFVPAVAAGYARQLIDDLREAYPSRPRRTLQFYIREGAGATVLRERISDCVFRLSTRDLMLTNAFGNFDLEPSE